MNSCAAWIVLVISAFWQGSKPADSHFSEAEIKDLGGLVLKYFKAKELGKSDDEGKFLGKLSESFDQIQKKRKGEGVLKFVKDWERVLDLSEEYAKDALVGGFEGMREFSTDDGTKHRYYVSVPKSYDKKEAAALLLAIPENGKDSPKDQFLKHWNAPAIKDGFIVLIPQMPEDMKTWSEPEGYGKALSPFAKIMRQAHIDCHRVLLAGVGAGARCAALIASNFPSRWAGTILRGEDIGFVFAENFTNLPVYAAKDGDTVGALGKKLQELGGNFTQGEDDLAKIGAWASDKTRNAYPATVMLRPPNPRARSAYWLRLEQWETTEGTAPEQQQASIKATIERDKNQITVTANGVKSFEILFNDAMLDLDKPVKVVTNGKEWIGTIPRSLQYFLDYAYSRNENRLVYVRGQKLDAPAAISEGSSK